MLTAAASAEVGQRIDPALLSGRYITAPPSAEGKREVRA
jgi:hypothetical protein